VAIHSDCTRGSRLGVRGKRGHRKTTEPNTQGEDKQCDSRVTSITVVLPLPLGPKISVRGGVNVIACAGGCQTAVREVRRTPRGAPCAPCARGTGTGKAPKRCIHCAAAGFQGVACAT